MKKAILISFIIVCLLIMIMLHHSEHLYISNMELISQEMAGAILGSMIGSGILTVLFSECKGS